MQEYQVSFDGETHRIERPFMTLATQNPAEHEGTYPLPDAQLDRFLLKVMIDYPSAEAERGFVAELLDGKSGDTLDISSVRRVSSVEELAAVQVAAGLVRVDREIVGYAVDIVGATRRHGAIRVGAGPRASLALVRLARARALSEGRDYATPDDVRAKALPALRHRIQPSSEWEIDGAERRRGHRPRARRRAGAPAMKATSRLVAGPNCGRPRIRRRLALLPLWRDFWWPPIALAFLAAALDAVLAFARPALAVSREAPEAMTQGKAFAVVLRVARPWPRARIRIFDGIPSDFEAEGLPMEFDSRSAAKGDSVMVLKYSVRPRARGICEWERGWVNRWRALSACSSRRERIASGGATRVYPDTEAFITGGFRLPGERGTTAGYRKSRRRGHGLEFEQLREYRRGDSQRLIDGRAPASYEGR